MGIDIQFKFNFNHSPLFLQIVVYRTEFEIPLATPEKFTPVPTPRRTRSRSQLSRFTDDDRTSHGAESLVSDAAAFHQENQRNVLELQKNGYNSSSLVKFNFITTPTILYLSVMRLSKRILLLARPRHYAANGRPNHWAVTASSPPCPTCIARPLRHPHPVPVGITLQLCHRGHPERNLIQV